MKKPLIDFFPAAVSYLIYNEIGPDKNGTGGFTNAEFDNGKATKWGITQKTLSVWRSDDCDEFDVKDLTRTEAETIYRVMYWQALSCHHLLNPSIATAMLDMGCLFGVGVSARNAQSAFISCSGVGLKVDGVIGANSVNALNAVRPNDWLEEYQNLFFARVDSIVFKNPSQVKWMNGWKRRIDKLKEVF